MWAVGICLFLLVRVSSGTPHPGLIRSSHQLKDKLPVGRPSHFSKVFTFTFWKGASINIY